MQLKNNVKKYKDPYFDVKTLDRPYYLTRPSRQRVSKKVKSAK